MQFRASGVKPAVSGIAMCLEPASFLWFQSVVLSHTCYSGVSKIKGPEYRLERWYPLFRSIPKVHNRSSPTSDPETLNPRNSPGTVQESSSFLRRTAAGTGFGYWVEPQGIYER